MEPITVSLTITFLWHCARQPHFVTAIYLSFDYGGLDKIFAGSISKMDVLNFNFVYYNSKTLRVEWRNSTQDCLGARAKK